MVYVVCLEKWLSWQELATAHLQGALGRGWEYARSSLMSTSDLLMTNARRRAESEGQKVTMQRTDWHWWDRSFVERNPYKVTASFGWAADKPAVMTRGF